MNSDSFRPKNTSKTGEEYQNQGYFYIAKDDEDIYIVFLNFSGYCAMESDRQSTPASTSEEEFLDIDGVSEENYAHLSDGSSLKMEDAFSATRKEEEHEAFSNDQSRSASVVKASESEQQFGRISYKVFLNNTMLWI